VAKTINKVIVDATQENSPDEHMIDVFPYPYFSPELFPPSLLY